MLNKDKVKQEEFIKRQLNKSFQMFFKSLLCKEGPVALVYNWGFDVIMLREHKGTDNPSELLPIARVVVHECDTNNCT